MCHCRVRLCAMGYQEAVDFIDNFSSLKLNKLFQKAFSCVIVVCLSFVQALCLCSAVFPAGPVIHQHRRHGIGQRCSLDRATAGGWWEVRRARPCHPHWAPGRPGQPCFPHCLRAYGSAGRWGHQGERYSVIKIHLKMLNHCWEVIVICF